MSQHRLGWKAIGLCVCLFFFLLSVWYTRPTVESRSVLRYRETRFAKAVVGVAEAPRSVPVDTELAYEWAEDTQVVVETLNKTSSVDNVRAAAPQNDAVAEPRGEVEAVIVAPAVSASPVAAGSEMVPESKRGRGPFLREKVKGWRKPPAFPLLREVVQFEGNPAAEPTAHRLLETGITDEAEQTYCRACSEPTCEQNCQRHDGLRQQLNRSSVVKEAARLHVVLVDPLAWLRQKESGCNAYREKLQDFVKLVKSTYAYRTFKGSDFVFVCTMEPCQDFGPEFAAALADQFGSRAIFAGIDVDGDSLKWPCPHRIISINPSEATNLTAIARSIVERGSFMIEGRNRWVCADTVHPPHHWAGIVGMDKTTGAYMKEYGFSICAIPKCGSSMTMVLLRRMMHYKYWNQTGNGVNHGPQAGISYVSHIKNQTERRAVNDDLTFVRAVIVRHPITRLLSGYLDKIFQKHQYNRVPGLKHCASPSGLPPSFPVFVRCLMELHPNPDKLDHHFRIMSASCNMRQTELDFVGKQSHLAEEIREFGQSLHFWEAYGASGWGDGTRAFGEKAYQARSHDSGSLVWKYYTEELMQKVYDYYEEDFLRFGFTLEEMLELKPTGDPSGAKGNNANRRLV